ncbi:helix-turn-helix transcriptional regulator [Chryseobacterium indologenes]|uniref:helix-turn-helix transcriptional regulator n=1 Tax=Chryseobacterium indologenes TaxID=253 RepID=UPI001BCDBFDC|nr:hypothetical protein [Chryseobacterium indologenes]
MKIIPSIYMNEQRYEEAMKIIPEGKILAEKYHDYYTLAWIYVEEGMIYTELSYTKRSRKSLNEALDQTGKVSNEEAHIIKATAYRTMARNLRKEDGSGKKDSILIYLHNGYNESRKTSTTFPYRNFYLSSFAIELSQEYYSKNDLINTEKYLVQFAQDMKTEKDQSEFIRYYILTGNIENKRKNYTKALENFEKATQAAKQAKIYPLQVKDIYSGKAESYLGLEDYKNQALYSAKAQKITDSILSVEKKVLNNVIAPPDRKNISNTENSESNNNKLLIIIVISFISITSFVIYVVYKRKNYNKTTETFTDNKESSIQNDILPAKSIKDTNTEDLSELIQLAHNNDKSFHLKFSETFPAFNKQLLEINPQLSHSDLEYCALIKLKFNTKEISHYKNVTLNSVISKKYRIRKKLNISTEENMYSWMLNLG